MKKIIYSLFVLISVSSCSSNDDNPTSESNILEGNWFFQRQDASSCSNDFTLGGGDPFEFQFLSDNTVSFTEPGSLTLSSYVLLEKNLTLEMEYTTSVRAYKFIGVYTYSESNQTFTGNFTYNAYEGLTTDTEILWICEGPTDIFK